MKRKTGHSSDQWFKLKTKTPKQRQETSRVKPRRQRKSERRRKYSGQIEVRGRSIKNLKTEGKNDEQQQ